MLESSANATFAGYAATDEIISRIRTRDEPGGRTVAFNPAVRGYLFINEPAVRLLRDLQAGANPEERCRDFAAETGLPLEDVAERLGCFLRVVCGVESAEAASQPHEQLPHAWTLQMDLGMSNEGCATFGMPL